VHDNQCRKSKKMVAAKNMTNNFLLKRFSILSLAPTITIMLFVFGAPLLFSLFLSFQGLGGSFSTFSGRFVGLENYSDLFENGRFTSSMLRTIYFTLIVVMIEMILGTLIALLLNTELKYIGFFRTLIILPMMVTPIVAALCWKLLFDANSGIINYLVGVQINWLGDPRTSIFAVAAVNVWQNSPFVAVLILAGLKSLPKDVLEAASLDGATSTQAFLFITLPLLKPYITVALLLRTIFEFRSFDNVFVMTGGGPADSTMLLSIFTYLVSFVRFDLSLAAAASWIMLSIVLILCFGLIGVLRYGPIR